MQINRQIVFLMGLSAFSFGHCRAGDTLPGQGYSLTRYEMLWTKSPFAVATPEGADQPSEFSLEGIANLEGVDYASLVNKRTNERYLLASGKPQNGLTLVSVTHGEDRDQTFAVIQNNGQTLTLKLTDTTSAAPATAGTSSPQVANAGTPTQPVGAPMWPHPPTIPPQTPGGFPSTMSPQTASGFPSTMSPQNSIPGNPSQPRPGQIPPPVMRHPIIHVPATAPQPPQ